MGKGKNIWWCSVICFIGIMLLCIGCASKHENVPEKQEDAKQEVIDISGLWRGENRDAVLILSLIVDGDEISGNHESVWGDGNRIDIGSGNSISGKMTEPKVYNVLINSGYGINAAVSGTVQVIDINTIKWNAVKYSGEVYIPKNCVLTR